MKTIMFMMGAAAVALSLVACNGTKRMTKSSAQTPSGTYTGTLPCADCQGIKAQVDINSDMTYRLQTRYIGKSDEAYTASGKFVWNAGDSTLTFDSKLLGTCKLENDILYVLVDGKKKSGANVENYMLTRVDMDLVEKYWKLLELYGSPVTCPSNSSKEAHITFRIEDNLFSGDAGCNRIMGSYKVEPNNHIQISATATTMMMCLDMETENKFLQVLKTADSYYVRNDTLTLIRARMAPLARFVSVRM